VPTAPLVVSFGGVESRAADNWYGLVYAGVLQMNVRVPDGAPAGAEVPVTVSGGGSQAVTIAIE